MKAIGGVAALLLLVVLASAGSGVFVHATTLAPTYSVSLSSSAASANANITVDYLADSPDSLESHHVSFIPSAFGVATGAAITNGAGVGQLVVTAAESTSNSACSNSSGLTYDMWEASTDTSITVADTPRIPASTWPGFLDANLNNLPDAVDKYPNFLNVLFPSLTPRSRSFGYNSGTPYRAANVLIFEPGTALPGMSPLDASLGYPVVVVLQDPTAPAAASTITDVCTSYHVIRFDRGKTSDNPNTTTVNEGNQTHRTNPVDGGYTFMEYGRTVRDLDDDGIENTLDTCPSVATPSWNPRVSDPIWDFDDDGIPGKNNPLQSGQLLAGTGCDTTPLVNTGSGDHDGDGFQNRQDNCPVVANGLAQDSQADPDADGIGSACDVVDSQPDGHLHEVCVTDSVSVGTGGTPPSPACPEYVLDMDNDGYSEAVELYVGTGPTDPCGNDGWPADLESTGVSENKVDIQDVTSFLTPTFHLFTTVGTYPGDNRWNLVLGTPIDSIDIADLADLIVLSPPMLEGAAAILGPPCPYAP